MPIDQRYAADYRVRFDEAGADGNLRAGGLLRFAQDLAWRHSDAAGFDRTWYREHGLTWLIRCVELEIDAPVTDGSTLAVTTEVIGWRRVWARRYSRFGIRRAVGTDDTVVPIGAARIDWVLLNTEGRPTRVPDEIVAVLGGPAAPFEPAHVALPDTPADAWRQPWSVRPRDLDPMGHVNNATWLDVVEEALAVAAPPVVADPRRPRRWCLEYLRPAEPGPDLCVSWWPLGDEWACRVTDAAGADLFRAWTR